MSFVCFHHLLNKFKKRVSIMFVSNLLASVVSKASFKVRKVRFFLVLDHFYFFLLGRNVFLSSFILFVLDKIPHVVAFPARKQISTIRIFIFTYEYKFSNVLLNYVTFTRQIMTLYRVKVHEFTTVKHV